MFKRVHHGVYELACTLASIAHIYSSLRAHSVAHPMLSCCRMPGSIRQLRRYISSWTTLNIMSFSSYDVYRVDTNYLLKANCTCTSCETHDRMARKQYRLPTPRDKLSNLGYHTSSYLRAFRPTSPMPLYYFELSLCIQLR